MGMPDRGKGNHAARGFRNTDKGVLVDSKGKSLRPDGCASGGPMDLEVDLDNSEG